METKNCWLSYDEKTVAEVMAFSDGYKAFLDAGKTERECIDYIVNEAEANGFRELSSYVKNGTPLKPGDKVYTVQMNKAIALFVIGTRPLEEGINILGAHIDSPRLDVKQNPMYEDSELLYLDTHYYGGVKKYQWVAIPLALHGVFVKKDGTTVELNVGEDEDDPVFFISDLLIHLSADQLDKKAAKVVEGEALDLIIGNRPLKMDGEEKSSEKAVKKAVLDLLKAKYDVEEDDFLSAELEIVPAGKSRDAGFDKSMILGYGHDDRVCAYPSFRALLEVPTPEKTSCCILVDKEEIGSVGATGMKSRFFEDAVAELLNLNGFTSNVSVRRCLSNSTVLSSDVSAAFDPLYASVFEKKNTAMLGHGIVFNKYTGARGKSGSNDANAEYMAYLRRVMDDASVTFQTCELGRVDAGGGGTIAYILARYGMNVIDAGIPVLSMHAPWETVSKADVYEAYKGYIAFLKASFN